MALDAVGLQQPLRYTVDLKEGLVQQPMSSQLMKGDKKANRVIVRITNGSETVDLSGVGVSGSFIRPPDEAELTLAGNANGNEAVIVLDDLCYAEEGYCEIDVKLTVNGVSRTILALTGYVLAKGNGAYIDVGNVIPNIDDIIAQYAEMKAVTERTLAAAQRAEALAIDASGYAANTGMLGGQPPEHYAKQETVTQLSEQIGNKLPIDGTAADSDKLGGKAANDYLLKNDAFSVTLEWQNGSPGSEYPAQNEQVIIAEYDYVLVEYRTSTNGNQYCAIMCKNQTGGLISFCTGNNQKYYSREFNISANVFYFSDAYANGVVSNWYCVPTRIWGIKGVEA